SNRSAIVLNKLFGIGSREQHTSVPDHHSDLVPLARYSQSKLFINYFALCPSEEYHEVLSATAISAQLAVLCASALNCPKAVKARDAKDAGVRTGVYTSCYLAELATPSCQDCFHNLAANVRQAKVAAAVPECQLCVIKTEKVQNRRVEVVNMDFVFYNLHTKIIRLAVSHAPTDSCSSQQR